MTVRKFLKVHWNHCGLNELPEKILNKQAMKLRIDETQTVANALDVDISQLVTILISYCE